MRVKYWILAAAMLRAGSAFALDGKGLFDKNCAACHTIGGGRKVGPDLGNVTNRRGVDWLVRFITSSAQTIASGDSTAVKLFEENGKIPMPPFALADADMEALLAYLSNPAGGTDRGADDVMPAFTPTVDEGRRLFTGGTPLANGGPSCVSCHGVKDDAVRLCGTLAKNLSLSYGKGIVQTMATTMPAMVSAYKGCELTFTEKANLEAYLKWVKDNQLFLRSGSLQELLPLGGLAVFCGLVLLNALFWRNPKPRTLRSEIFERQVRVLERD